MKFMIECYLMLMHTCIYVVKTQERFLILVIRVIRVF